MNQHDAMIRAAALLLVDDMRGQYRAGRKKPHIVIRRYTGLTVSQMIAGATYQFCCCADAASRSGTHAATQDT